MLRKARGVGSAGRSRAGRGSGLWEVTSSSRVGREPVGNRPRSLGRILQMLKVCC